MTKPDIRKSSREGYHQFRAEDTEEEYGSFEVFWVNEENLESEEVDDDGAPEYLPAGWYWHACFPGCTPDGDPLGPYDSSTAAYRDAREED